MNSSAQSARVVTGVITRLRSHPQEGRTVTVTDDAGRVTSFKTSRQMYFPGHIGDLFEGLVIKGVLQETMDIEGKKVPFQVRIPEVLSRLVLRIQHCKGLRLPEETIIVFLKFLQGPEDETDHTTFLRLIGKICHVREMILRNSEFELQKEVQRLQWLEGFKEGSYRRDALQEQGRRSSVEKRVTRFYMSLYDHLVLPLFYVIGLNNEDIRTLQEETMLSLSQLYERLYIQPFYVVQLPFEKAMKVALTLRLTFSEFEIKGSLKARFLYAFLKENKAVCISLEDLMSMKDLEAMKYARVIRDCGFAFDEEHAHVYLHREFVSEKNVSESLLDMLHRAPWSHAEEDIDLPSSLDASLDDEQHIAVRLALQKPISIITGRAGTGKTTVLKEILKQFKQRKKHVMVCALSGMAVVRCQEATGQPSITVDLALTSSNKVIETFGSLPNVIIIDEVSMVTTYHVAELLRQFPVEHLVLVGDIEQIEPIGMGNFMEQMLLFLRAHPGTIPMTTLKFNYRLSRDGDIRGLVDTISTLNDQPASFRFQPSASVELFRTSDLKSVLTTLLFQRNVSLESMCILSPTNRTVDVANQIAVDLLQEADPNMTFCDPFFVGARVMNIENRYDFDIMNGEQGRVMALIEDNDTENTQKRTLVRVRFPDVKKVSREHSPVVKNKGQLVYTRDEAGNCWKDIFYVHTTTFLLHTKKEDVMLFSIQTSLLKLSYATTINKIQGSERENVIFFVPSGSYRDIHMLHKRLINVAVTRAKCKLFVVGDIEAIERKVRDEPPIRKAFLWKRLLEGLT